MASSRGRRPGNFDEATALQHGFVRRENTYHLLLLLLRQRAEARGDLGTVALINKVLRRANEGDAIKHDLIAMMSDTE